MKTNTLIVVAFFLVIAFSLLVINKKAHAETTSTIPLCEITRNLTIGNQGEDVLCLQRYLNWSGFIIASSGVGSPGFETTYFGPLTANAVARWQNSYASQILIPVGLSSGTGYWGPSSFNHYVSLVRSALGA